MIISFAISPLITIIVDKEVFEKIIVELVREFRR
jgi:hypothetical protein